MSVPKNTKRNPIYRFSRVMMWHADVIMIMWYPAGALRVLEPSSRGNQAGIGDDVAEQWSAASLRHL